MTGGSERIDRHHDGAGSENGVHGHERLDRFRQSDADAIAGFDSRADQRTRRPGDPVDVVGPRERGRAVVERLGGSVDPSRFEAGCVDELAQDVRPEVGNL